MISGKTTLIAHLGYPTEAFKAPMIYNPLSSQQGIDAVVVPMGVKADDYPAFLRQLFQLTNIRGALVTMPHKVTTVSLVDEVTPTARIAGAANAILLRPDGTLLGDQFDGAGFVRGVERKGRQLEGARALVVGSRRRRLGHRRLAGGRGVAAIGLYDVSAASAEALGRRLREHYPALEVRTGSNDPAGFDVVVNATPLGMKDGDPLPFDMDRARRRHLRRRGGDEAEHTPLPAGRHDRGLPVQVGTDMLFEMIPAYLEFFGFGTATPDELRATAKIQY